MNSYLDKFNFIFLSFVYFIAVGLIIHFVDWNLQIIIFVVSIFIWLLIILYKDVFIPKIPKLIFSLFSIAIILCIFLFNLNISGSFIFIFLLYYLMESYYNPNIDDLARFKNWKNIILIIILAIVGIFLFGYLIFSVLFSI